MDFKDIDINPAMIDQLLDGLVKSRVVEVKFYLRHDLALEVIKFVENLETDKTKIKK